MNKLFLTLSLGLMITPFISQADDTELYVFESTSRSGVRPQVLIIFDNSGSMKRVEENAEAGFDPNKTYGSSSSSNIYYNKGGAVSESVPIPLNTGERRYFSSSINGCDVSKYYLKNYGFFTGFFREYRYRGENGVWQELPDGSGEHIKIIDCFDDIESVRWENAQNQPHGFPIDGVGNSANPTPYTNVNASSSKSEVEAAILSSKQTGFGTGRSVTLYTENYLNWLHGPKEKVDQTRIDIAKTVVNNTVITTPSVDFGLSIFNYNFPGENRADGGRIISGIKNMTDKHKIELLKNIVSLDPKTNTPLCETLYEVKRYFAGEEVVFGAADKGHEDYSYIPNVPVRDASIEKQGMYQSPFKPCQNQIYVVYITDGAPTRDRAADSAILALEGVKPNAYTWESVVEDSDGDKKTVSYESYLPNLAQWLYNADVNSDIPGKQTVKTFTIGFSSGAVAAEPVLAETAVKGGGEYFAAKNASELREALQQVFSQILEVNASFTSPSIASNNFDRTQTFDAVYYAMFLPNKGPRWVGNLKKFRVTGDGVVVDKKGKKAIGRDGNLASAACSFWTPRAVCNTASDGGDGNDVTSGGAAYQLRTAQRERTILSNIGNNGNDLAALNTANASAWAGSPSRLAQFAGVRESELERLMQWAAGVDVDDDNSNGVTTDRRSDIIGDPLHSKPLALNLGSNSKPDMRILLGTNHGFLHMFKDDGDTVKESWAFMPHEFIPELSTLKKNVPTGVHSVYGLDSSPVAYIETGAKGRVKKAWVFVGMRRGGKSYYALDVSNPDYPRFLWTLNSSSPHMQELGQTWSEPVVTRIPGWPTGNDNPDMARPVLIFGAGYDPQKDNPGQREADSMGRGVFIVDAETGKLVHRFGVGAGSGVTVMPGLRNSIPNSVGILDSNNDQLTDRLYATDTGGNVWRIDLPSANKANWSAHKFAALSGSTLDADRRFFVEPVIAQTMSSQLNIVKSQAGEKVMSYQNIPFDAIAVSSGLRPNPTDKTRDDKLFLLRDKHVVTQTFDSSNRPAPIKLRDLYSVTNNPPANNNELVDFAQKDGWYYSLTDSGEKSLAGAAIINGRVYYSSYVPGDNTQQNSCLIAGEGRLYAFDLHTGGKVYAKPYLSIGERVPDTPQLVIPPNADKPSYMYLVGVGKAGDVMSPQKAASGCREGDGRCVGGGLDTQKIYYYRSEQ